MATRWSLESLTVGPLSCRTDADFWHDAFRNFPAVPRLKEVTIIYYYQNTNTFDMGCWAYFNTHFCRKDLFLQSMGVEIQVTIRSERLNYRQGWDLAATLSPLRRCRLVTFWGRSEYGTRLFVLPFLTYRNQRLLVNANIEALSYISYTPAVSGLSRYRAFGCPLHTLIQPILD